MATVRDVPGSRQPEPLQAIEQLGPRPGQGPREVQDGAGLGGECLFGLASLAIRGLAKLRIERLGLLLRKIRGRIRRVRRCRQLLRQAVFFILGKMALLFGNRLIRRRFFNSGVSVRRRQWRIQFASRGLELPLRQRRAALALRVVGDVRLLLRPSVVCGSFQPAVSRLRFFPGRNWLGLQTFWDSACLRPRRAPKHRALRLRPGRRLRRGGIPAAPLGRSGSELRLRWAGAAGSPPSAGRDRRPGRRRGFMS